MEKLSLLQLFARNLRAAMDKNPAADTQQKIEDRCGISQQHVSKLLKGQAAPTLDTLELLARAVGCQPWELLVDSETVRRAAIERMIQPISADDKVIPMRRRKGK